MRALVLTAAVCLAHPQCSHAGDNVFQANYQSGLRVLDSSKIDRGVLSEVRHAAGGQHMITHTCQHADSVGLAA